MEDFNQQLSEYRELQEQSKKHIKQASENVANSVATAIRLYRDQMPKEVESVILDLAMHYQDGAIGHCRQIDQSAQVLDNLLKHMEELIKINQQHMEYSIQLAHVLKEAGVDVGQYLVKG
jgi:hypothetical protein